jgi:hypothetical protein
MHTRYLRLSKIPELLSLNSQLYLLLRYSSWRAVTFWNIIALITDSLLLAAFILRVVGIVLGGDSVNLRLTSFQVLSFVAPFIWCVLTQCTVFKAHDIIRMSMSF